MFKSKSKGFTMVELLATVTILGILATIATVSVTRTMQKAHKEYDQKQNKLFTTAAQTYFTDNRNALPKKLLTTSEVTLQELIDKNYIEEIVDYKKKAYDKENSKAYVKKTGAGKYIYYSILVSGDGKRTESDAPDTNNNEGKVSISIKTPDLTYTDMKKSLPENNIIIYYVNKQITIPIELSSTTGISSYQYKINKLSSITATGKKYKTSGEIAIDNKSFSDTISINAKDFANGIYQLEIDAYGYKAESSTQKASYIIVIDKTKPKCTISVNGTKGDYDKDIGTRWFKAGKLTAKMTITEQNNYMYTLGFNNMQNNIIYEKNNTKEEEKYLISQNIKNKKVYGYVIDKAGNEGKCETEKPIYYDNTKPTCEIKSEKEPDGNNGWYLSAISLSLKRYDDNRQNQSEQGDNESGITAYGLSNNSTSNYNSKYSDTIDVEGANIIRYGYVKDKAGNEGKCEKIFKLETNNPTCKVNFNKEQSKINNSYTGWFTENVSATVGYETETISGISRTHVKYGDRPTSSDPNNITLNDGTDDWVYGELVDNAGRWATCEKYTRVDTVKPTCNISLNGTHGNGGWYKAGELKATITIDETNKNKYAVGFNNPTSYNNNTEGTETYTISTSVKGEKLEVNLLDEAGNPGHCETDPIYYDNELPSCSVSGGSPTWTNKNVTISAICTDTGGSDCVNGNNNVDHSIEYKTDIDTTTAGAISINNGGTVSDKAGNTRDCPANQTVKIDKTPPTCPTITADKTAKSWMKSSVTLTFSNFTTDSSTYDWYTNVDADKKNTFTKNSSNNISTTTKTISADGKRIGKLIVYDLAGNPSSDCFTDEFWIDTIGPNISLEVKNIYDAFSKSGCGTNANCTLLYETTIANKKTVYHGVTLEADNECDKNISCSPIADWGAQAKYEKGGTGCNWGDGIDYTWAGAAVCTTAGSGRVKRCYKVKDSAGNTSAKICSCQENDKTVNLKEPNQCF